MALVDVKKKREIILKKIADAMNNGDEKLEAQLMKELPIEPSTAYAIKKVWGMEELEGYNLEMAKLVYGENAFK